MKRAILVVGMLTTGLWASLGCKSAITPSTGPHNIPIANWFNRDRTTDSLSDQNDFEWTSGGPLTAQIQDERPIVDRRVASFAEFTNQVTLAAHSTEPDLIQLTAINEHPVQSWQEVLKQAHAMPTDRKIQIDYRAPQSAITVETARMASAHEVWNVIAAQLQPGQQLRWTEDGTDRITFRQDTVISTVWLRRMPGAKIYHVYMHLRNIGQQDVRVPLECIAFADNQPLRCLTAAETLSRIYIVEDGIDKKGKNQRQMGVSADEIFRFSFVSARKDYLTPTNIQERKMRSDPPSLEAKEQAGKQRPAFLPAYLHYPGPAIRFDAIALGGSMLQATWLEPGATVDGWIIFGDDGSTIRQRVDLQMSITESPSSNQSQTVAFEF